MSNTVPKPVVNNLPVRSRKRPPLSTDINGTPADDRSEEIYEAALNLKIEQLDLNTLKPPPIELRKHSPRQIHLLKKSVQAFGVVKPVLIDGDGVIVAGYGVYRAAKALKRKSIPVVRLEHLSPVLIRMYSLMDNQSAMLGENDPALVRLELEELSGISLKFNLDLELTGFAMSQIDNILLNAPSPDAEHGSEETDDVELAQSDPVTRPGDLWLVADHRIYCGNSLESRSYEVVMSGQLADMIAADGPFNVKMASIGGKGKHQHREFANASGEMNSGEFVQFQRTVFAHLVKHSKVGSIHYQFMNWRSALEILLAGRDEYTELKNIIVWSKTNAGMGSFYRSQHELIFVFKSGNEPHFCSFGLGETGRYRTNVITQAGCNTFSKSRDEDLAAHPTVKPTSLIADLIRDCSRRGEVILDPFGGSGTTLLAAEWTGRQARLIELDGRYVDVALKRARRRFRLEAKLAATGQSFDEVAAERGCTFDEEEGSIDG
jgi:DNA modification methylase